MDTTGYVPRHSGHARPTRAARPQAPPGYSPGRPVVLIGAALVMIAAGLAIAAAVSARPTPACPGGTPNCSPAVSSSGLNRGIAPVPAPRARIFAQAADGFDGPSAVTVAAGRVWVTNVL